MKTASVSLLVLALALSADAIRIEYTSLPPEIIQQTAGDGEPQAGGAACDFGIAVRYVGCDGANLTTLAVPHSKEPDIICTLQSEGAGAIVVGGHFDFIDRGMGAVDDWSGAALLPSLYRSLQSTPRRHRFIFIGFAGEEEGLFGSTQYVRKLSPEERKATRAMINLECLGLDPPKVWGSRAGRKLLAAYFEALAAIHMPASIVNVDRVGDDDSHPFLSAGIPVLTIHSITSATFPLLHTSGDQVSAIHSADYYDAYKVAAAYLAYLDAKLE